MDRIEKRTMLRAPLPRVWAAISDAKQFGAWFGVAFDGEFAAGQRLTGKIAPTKVDPEVAKQQEPYAGRAFEIVVEAVEPMTRFAFRWHPFAIDPAIDYSKEPMTLVEFRLEEAPGGTRLTIVESGFDKIPLERRAKAFEANTGGWDHQSRLLEKYLA